MGTIKCFTMSAVCLVGGKALLTFAFPIAFYSFLITGFIVHDYGISINWYYLCMLIGLAIFIGCIVLAIELFYKAILYFIGGVTYE